MTSVTIPDSVTSIGWYAFWGCTSLTSINVGPDNPSYSSIDGVLFNKEFTTLIQAPGAISGAYTIPDSVTSIGMGAFRYCTALTSVTIPNSVTYIGTAAFFGCTALTGVTIPNSVTTIENWAFFGCTSLTSVTIGNSVTSLGNEMFRNCAALTSVLFHGEPPTSVGSWMFYNSSPTVYYRYAHRDSWDSTFVGRPTAIWPEFGSLTLHASGPSLIIHAGDRQDIIVQVSTNLLSGTWDTIDTITVESNNTLEYIDADYDPRENPMMFYRIMLP